MKTLTSLPTNQLVATANDYKYIIQSTLRQEGRHTRNTKQLAKQLPIINQELQRREYGNQNQ